MSKESNQAKTPQEPTVTEKSSGLEYVSARLDPAQESKVAGRESTTKNDKS